MTQDLELMLAKLLGQIDESSTGEEFMPDVEFEDLSEEQLKKLCEAKSCLRLLDQMREFDQASTMNHGAVTIGPDNTGFRRPGFGAGARARQGKLGRYLVRKKIGEGGFAEVFLAHDPILDRDVALKIPRLAALSDEAALQRFLREGKAAATLDHPAIIPVYEAGKDGPYHFISMALCEGQSMAAMLAEPTFSIDEKTAASVASQIAKALSHAHSRGIIHRDVKPGNILVDNPTSLKPDLANRVRLTDFGLVKYGGLEDQELTTDGALLGTPAYMSPEQAQGQSNIGPSSDLFSLGSILYQLLSGNLPHRKETAFHTLQAVTSEAPEPLRLASARTSRDLEAITLKCLQKKPEDRYESAFLLAEDLDSWLEGRPITARLPGPVERLSRWFVRNPVLAGSVAFSVLSILIGLGFALWGWSDAADKNNKYLAASHSAESESRRARNSLNSLISSFEAMDPLQEGNDSVSAVSVLLKARQEVNDRFKNDIPATIELLTALARSFTGVGSYDHALSCRQAIFDLTLSEHGTDDPRYLAALRELANAEHNAGNLVKSLELREDFVSTTEKYLGAAHPDTIQAMVGLGASYRAMGKIRQAIDLHERTSLLSEFAATKHGLYSDVAINLAATYQAARLLERAIAINENELEQSIRVLGETHPDTLEVMSALATSWYVAGKKAQALETQTLVASRAREQFGEDDPTTLRYKSLTAWYQPQSKLAIDGIEILSEVVESANQKFGEEHPATIYYMNELGKMYRSVRDFEPAIEFHTRCRRLSEKLHGPNDYRSIELLVQLCRDKLRIGEHGQAIHLAQEAVDRIVSQVGPEHLLVTEAKQSLSLCCYMGGQYEKARRLTEQNLAALVPQLGQFHSKVAISQRRYVYILLELEEFEMAESFAKKMVDRLSDKTHIKSHRVARNLLANAQLEQGKFNEANETLTLALKEKSFGYPASAFARCVRGTVLLNRGEIEAARKWLLPSAEKLVTNFDDLQFPHQRSMTIRFAERAGRLFRQIDDVEKFNHWQGIVAGLKSGKRRLESKINSSQIGNKIDRD